MTAFKLGDKVRSRTDYQGLRLGHTYLVVDVRESPTPFGTFVEYSVRPADLADGAEGFTLGVVNGHLVLELEPAPSPVRVRVLRGATSIPRRRS